MKNTFSPPANWVTPRTVSVNPNINASLIPNSVSGSENNFVLLITFSFSGKRSLKILSLEVMSFNKNFLSGSLEILNSFFIILFLSFSGSKSLNILLLIFFPGPLSSSGKRSIKRLSDIIKN